MAEQLQHGVRRMSGRDPEEGERASTPLELLFDLTFVIAFGTAADELAHLLAKGDVAAGTGGFLLATFAVSWAWINFSWFASAYDTDDWAFRLTTMVQMVGVLLLALGLPAMFDSLVEGETLDLRLMIIGYVVMRGPMLAQWARAARQDPTRADACRVMIVSLAVAQAGWLLLLPVHASIPVMTAVVLLLIGVEVLGPALAEGRHRGTPWHGGHIAERYGLMVIIALGEGLLGTAATLQALVAEGWSVDIVVLGVAGVGLTFGVWWSYFVIPHGALLSAHRERSFGWGYGQMAIFGAVVAIGAGLHAAAYALQDDSELGTLGTVLATAAPVAVYVVGLFALYAALSRTADPFHLVLLGGSVALLGLALVLAATGVSVAWCLLVVALVPWVTVVGYETVGHRHNAEVLAALGGPGRVADWSAPPG